MGLLGVTVLTSLSASDLETAWGRSLVSVRDEVVRLGTLAAGCGPRLVFSALDSSVAGDVEATFAQAGQIVVSNARNHRMDALVPLLVPEINPEHLALLPQQRKRRGWQGCIVTNPNCSTIFLALALAALRKFGPERVVATTMQALSGAGYPGVASLDALGNVVPFIDGEEEKIELEPKKILGVWTGDGFALGLSRRRCRRRRHAEGEHRQAGIAGRNARIKQVAPDMIRGFFRSSDERERGEVHLHREGVLDAFAVLTFEAASGPTYRLELQRGSTIDLGRVHRAMIATQGAALEGDDDDSDTDVYHFRVSSRLQVSASVIPAGQQYLQGPQGGTPSPFDSNLSGDVTIEVLNASGTVRRVSGLPPLSIVVGNAHGVRMTYDGQPGDLARHTKIDVARLTLE